MTEWRTIDSAPRDGTWVMLAGGDLGFSWEGETTPYCVTGQWNPPGKSWQSAWYDSGYLGEYDDPTHWMPLPAPPTEKSA